MPVALVLALALGAGACARPRVAPPPPGRTVESVVAEIGPRVRPRLALLARAAGLEYPPRELALLVFKRERRLEAWGRDLGPWVRLDALPVLAASGGPGPKLRQGDHQVPEGVYRVVALNPNSRFHLSMMLDYPNPFDLAAAAAEGRTDLGGEIFIHGGAASIGCVAVGDRLIEALFVLAADVGLERVRAVIAPHDPRASGALAPLATVPSTAALYPALADALGDFGHGAARAAP